MSQRISIMVMVICFNNIIALIAGAYYMRAHGVSIYIQDNMVKSTLIFGVIALIVCVREIMRENRAHSRKRIKQNRFV
jgi:hypothetical protein